MCTNFNCSELLFFVSRDEKHVFAIIFTLTVVEYLVARFREVPYYFNGLKSSSGFYSSVTNSPRYAYIMLSGMNVVSSTCHRIQNYEFHSTCGFLTTTPSTAFVVLYVYIVSDVLQRGIQTRWHGISI